MTMDFKLKIFVYLDDSLPTPEAVLLVRQVFSQNPVLQVSRPIFPRPRCIACVSYSRFRLKPQFRPIIRRMGSSNPSWNAPVLSLMGSVKAAMFYRTPRSYQSIARSTGKIAAPLAQACSTLFDTWHANTLKASLSQRPCHGYADCCGSFSAGYKVIAVLAPILRSGAAPRKQGHWSA